MYICDECIGLCNDIIAEEIEQNDWNLNIARYVQSGEEEEEIDVTAEVVTLIV